MAIQCLFVTTASGLLRARWRLEVVSGTKPADTPHLCYTCPMDHDHSYKALFSHPEMVADLLRGFVREEWVNELDFSTLEKVGEPLIESHIAAHCVLRMECKASEAVNGRSLHNELNAAVRLQNQCPEGLWQNHALAVSRASAS